MNCHFKCNKTLKATVFLLTSLMGTGWAISQPAQALSSPPQIVPPTSSNTEKIPLTDSSNNLSQLTESSPIFQEQKDSPASICSTSAYMESEDIIQKTFLFPNQSNFDPKSTVLSFRRYIYTNRQDESKQNIRNFRHYEFMRNSQSGQIIYPYEVPVATGRGITKFDQAHQCTTTQDLFIDGENIICCEVPPSNQVGRFFQYNNIFYRTADNLYTVSTPAGIFQNCQMVCVYGPNKKLDQGSSIIFYAPKLGEVLSFTYNPQTKDFYPRTVLAAYEKTNRPSLDKTPPKPDIGLYLAAPNIASKTFTTAVPENLKKENISQCFIFYNYEHIIPFAHVKCNWKRHDAAADPNDPERLITPDKEGMQGIDFIDAESQAYMRLYKGQEGINLTVQIPPLSSLDTPYMFENRWYQVDSDLYDVNTAAGSYSDCLRVTYFGREKGKLTDGSYRAYYAPNLGEIGRESYNPKSKSFELNNRLYQFKVGATSSPK
ncbi:MAG: hypothetical protein ACI376_05985 [Candidatus Bruticola sp.]